MHQRKEITTLGIYQYRIIHHTVIETYFEMLKFSEHEIVDAIKIINLQFLRLSEVP